MRGIVIPVLADALDRSLMLAAAMDSRGYGRRADVLKVAGENVSTVEVEQVLAAHPAVLEAAVIGMPDPVRDEVPVAFVVAADPARPPTLEELFDWCTDRLARSKRPRDISFVDELPRTSVGKIRKFLLKDPTAEQGVSR